MITEKLEWVIISFLNVILVGNIDTDCKLVGHYTNYQSKHNNTNGICFVIYSQTEYICSYKDKEHNAFSNLK